jgi:hypothetical protein
LAQRRVDGQTLVDRQLLVTEPHAALLSKQVADRRAWFEVAVQHRGDLVLDLRAALDQPSAS